MRMSRLFSQTLREAPSEAETASHQLLLRAGFIRQLAAGIFASLPLARRTLAQIEAIMREEIDAIGGQEISMPVVHSADVWKETGRWYQIGTEMGRFKDKTGRDMVLAMTHEEVVADLVRGEIRSLPAAARPDLPYPDQVARRPAPAGRAAAGPRVHHEGQLQPGCQTGKAWTSSTRRTTRPTSTSSSAAACR